MTTTINSLIEQINTGAMTVEQAVDAVEAEGATYGIQYFSPSTEAELPYWDMLREWTRRQDERPAEIVPAPAPVEMKHCSCGHTVPRIQVMSASLGSSCPDCYDRMSG